MARAPDFKQLLAHAINPTGGAGVLLEDAGNVSALWNPGSR
jgi:hypothetical protein